jgi:hypothetical protein
MIKGNATTPRVYSWKRTETPGQIDRVNEIKGDVTLNQDKLYEVGRTLKLGIHKLTPDTPITINQNEYLTMKFWRELAGLNDPDSGDDHDVTLEDLKDAVTDISASLTDDSGAFEGTVYFAKMRLGGFTIDVGDPDAKITRNFSLVGEYCKIIVDNYLAYATATAVGDGIQTIALSPAPIETTIFRVLRIRAGVVSELVEDSSSPYADNTYRLDSSNVIIQTGLTGDIHKVFYPSATAYTTLWTDNDSDPEASYADQCDIYLKVGSEADAKVYRLQSVNIDVALERDDKGEIGNKEKVQYGVKTKTVTVKLGRLLETFTLEQILADQSGVSDSKIIDVRDFVDTVELRVKFYTDNTKTTFAFGYKVTGLSAESLSPLSAQPEEYNPADNSMTSDNFLVSDDETEIDA